MITDEYTNIYVPPSADVLPVGSRGDNQGTVAGCINHDLRQRGGAGQGSARASVAFIIIKPSCLFWMVSGARRI